MAHSHGYRARTRHSFAKKFGEHGMPKPTTYMKVYKVGDYVDIKVNGAIHKGMPFKFYHGKTGIVYNVTKSSLGIIINKKVGNRYLEKRINVRIEHVQPSKCRDDFLARTKLNAELKAAAKAEGKSVCLKRLPAMPRKAHLVSTKGNEPVSIVPVPYEALI